MLYNTYFLINFIVGNNLYGFAQSELLPTDQYRWLTKKEVAAIDWRTIDTETETGFICEVDLSYPPELHRKHNSFILAPEQRSISYSDLSPYSQGKAFFSFSNVASVARLQSSVHARALVLRSAET
jgi:hypothetical protein